ncbi:peroxidase [Candidatus Poribacteria bacterium]|nr:MAG: peroxidase [Candidatus Poribacteria bacterium]
MAWIQTIEESDATGIVKEEYDASIERAGHLYNIVKLFSIRPKSMQAFIQLNKIALYDDSCQLTRIQREMIATVVSKVNQCHY